MMTEDEDVIVESRAMRTFQAGEAITMYYGARSNTELMKYSGFVQPENAYDFVPVYLHLPAEEPLAAFKAKVFLQKADVEVVTTEPESDGWIFPLDIGWGKNSLAFALSVARVLITGKEGINSLLKSGERLPSKSLGDEEEESGARSMLREALKTQLGAYEEAELKRSGEMSDSARKLISELQSEEKKILEFALSDI